MKSTPVGIFIVSMCISFLAIGISVYIFVNKPKPLAYIDVAKIIEKYQGMTDARKSYQQKTTVWQSNIDTLKVELDKVFQDYGKNASKMTAKEAELSRELLKTKEQQYLQYKDNIRQKAMEEDKKMTETVLLKVNLFLKEYGNSKGYAFIFAANGNGSMAYADERLDITEEVLVKLNQAYKGE